MNYRLINTTKHHYENFENISNPTSFDLRKNIFALITEDPYLFLRKYSIIRDKLKGILLIPGKELKNEKLAENLHGIWFNQQDNISIEYYTDLYLDFLSEKVMLQNKYDALKIESERTSFQYTRLQKFYNSVQEKIRLDVKNQNKWTIEALTLLIEFRNSALAESDISQLPKLIAEFIGQDFFNYSGIALIEENPKRIKSYSGLITDDIFANDTEKHNYILKIPLNISSLCDCILIIADSKDYHFKEYEKSFFILLAEIISVTYNEKLSYQALSIAKEEAESANKMKTQFMANMSHEIRNPLNGVLGMADLLNKTDLSIKQNQYLSLLKNSATSLRNIIGDLLDFAAIEKGKLVSNDEIFSPTDCIIKTVEINKALANHKDLNILHKIDFENIYLNGDLGKLQQIISNFISNAIKYSNSGTITVEAELLNQSRDSVDLKISVSDEGPGIPRNKLETIFQSFTQLEDTYTKNHQGLGLGLSIVKNLAEFLGGTISVKSQLNEGSCFSVCIPFQIAEKAELANNEIPPSTSPGRYVLIAEDEIINMLYLEQIFLESGYNISKASNGREVIENIDLEKFDLFLFDIGMPDVSGIECIEHIRSRNIETPAIALSGYSSRSDIEKFHKAGFNEVLSKPVDIDILNNTINKLLKDSI